MIVKMTKYTLVVLAAEKEGFLERLQELGLVDVTSIGWEPSEEERTLMTLAEKHREAVECLREITGDVGAATGAAGVEKVRPFSTGTEAFEKYEAAWREIVVIEAEIARYRKLLDEAAPLGEIDTAMIRDLERHGVSVESLLEETGFDTSQNINIPAENPAEMRAHIASLEDERRGWDKVVARAAATVDSIETEGAKLKDQLHLSRSKRSGAEAAEGSLVVMEAWAREKQAPEVDAMLETHPAVYFIKERPTPNDETPVELHNSRIVRPFEFIAEMYAMPRYGTMDLTRWFAPFYMLFFAFCLADAGYGLLLFAGGLFVVLKGTGAMKAIGKLSMWCGGASVVFGFLAGSLFGVNMKEWGFMAGAPFFPDDDMFLFGAAIGLGVLQILFGMVLKVVTTARAFGIKYALSTVGWFVTLLAGGALLAQNMMGMLAGVPAVVIYSAIGVGAFMMLFLNNPDKNPLVNFGGGLWNLYNDLTGFLSDALSYIRLFAIGLSGGALATVFNDLAFGMSPDIPVAGQIVTLIILLVGHGLNLFMSTLSSMVHPLRLTFVEFYKNAGFDASQRIFEPLKKSTK